MKQARFISILKPGKDPVQLLPYRPVSVLDTIVKVFKKILPATILNEVGWRRLLRDKQFRFTPKRRTSRRLDRLFETVFRNFGEKPVTG